MRFLFVVLLMAGIWVSGWIVGSLNPAPAFILNPVQSWLSDNDAPEHAEDLDPDAETIEADEPESAEPEALPASDPDPAPPVVELEGDEALAQYRVWISEARAAHPYPDSEQRMFDVMMCESGGNPGIVNPAGPYTGLFQYVAGTWNGDWNTYRDSDITDARAQIFATALAWSLNMQNQWGCYSRSHN
nr:hypothetical protein [Hyphomonas sp. Mor2]